MLFNGCVSVIPVTRWTLHDAGRNKKNKLRVAGSRTGNDCGLRNDAKRSSLRRSRATIKGDLDIPPGASITLDSAR